MKKLKKKSIETKIFIQSLLTEQILQQITHFNSIIRRLDPVEYHRWSDRTNATMRHRHKCLVNKIIVSKIILVSRYNNNRLRKTHERKKIDDRRR